MSPDRSTKHQTLTLLIKAQSFVFPQENVHQKTEQLVKLIRVRSIFKAGITGLFTTTISVEPRMRKNCKEIYSTSKRGC